MKHAAMVTPSQFATKIVAMIQTLTRYTFWLKMRRYMARIANFGKTAEAKYKTGIMNWSLEKKTSC